MSQPKSPRKRQQQQARTRRHEAKRREVRNSYKPRTTGKVAVQTVSRQPARGLPKLVRKALDRMIARHKLLTMPRPTDDVQQAAA